MNPSALNLLRIQFLRTSVEVNEESETRDALRFDFDGTFLGWGLEHGRIEDMENTWWVGLGFATSRQPEKGPVCPYVIDVQAVGIFRVDDSVSESGCEEFVVECGAGLLFSAIREMVSNITARSAAGPILLPTVSFKGALGESKAHKSRPKKKKARKKKTRVDR